MRASKNLAITYAARFPAEAVRRLDTLTCGEVGGFLTELDPPTAVGLITRMPPHTAGAALETMDLKVVAAILDGLPVTRCVLVLRSVNKNQRASMIGLLPRDVAASVERLLRSPRGSAGDLAEPVPAVLSPQMIVEEALRVAAVIPGRYAFVVDDDARLVGVINRNELAKSDPRTRIGNLMATPVIRLPSAAPHSAVRDHRAWNDFDVLPVVDNTGVLVGVVRHRDVRRLAHASRMGQATPRPALATAMELSELYWGGLTSLLASLSTRLEPENPAEVNRGA